jgi:hypothetical protein
MTPTATSHYNATRTRAIDSFFDLLSRSTVDDLHAAETWYAEARSFAESLRVIRPQWTLEVSASVVSAFSPRVTWGHNKAKALQYAQGVMPKGLRSHIYAADRCAVWGFSGLRGPKTNAFARAIAGDDNAVVVDVWMCRAAGLGKDAPNKTEYRAIADAIRDMSKVLSAEHFFISPATLQALLWIVIRGKAQ